MVRSARSTQMPDDAAERAARETGARRVAGVDEVGRGPLAGPVTAAAVCLDPASIPEGLRDSKRLSAARRRALAASLRECADVGVGHANVDEIAALNILGATYLAMRRALAALRVPADFALIDGRAAPPGLDVPHRCIVRGDAASLSIAAASIVAKVERDAIMARLAEAHPGYGWESNAGYPTAAHRAALARLGVTPHHRCNFRPVHNILYPGRAISD